MVRRVARSYAKDVNQIPLASNGICDVTYFVVPHFSPLEGEFAKCLLIFVSVGDSRTRHCVCFAGRYSDDLNGFDVLSTYTDTFICSKIRVGNNQSNQSSLLETDHLLICANCAWTLGWAVSSKLD